MAGVILGHAPLGVLGIIYAGIPSVESWGFVVASGLVHIMYQIFLLNAYRFGELTQVYPIARGSAPIIITLVSFAFLSVELSLEAILGIFIISGTIIIHGISQFRSHSADLKSLYLALLAGCCIAGYSIIDGYGTRISGNVLAFYGASTVVNVLLFIPYIFFVEKDVFRQLIRPEGLKIFLIGGTASYLAYIAALWAVLSTPIAVVSSMRETSVVFALLLGTLILKEKITAGKIAMTFFILLGVVVLRLN